MHKTQRRHVLLNIPIAIVVLSGLGTSTATAKQRAPADHPRSQFPAFVLDHGRYKSFEAARPKVRLVPGDINNDGTIVGEYLAPKRESGFLRNRQGRITRIDLPRAAGTQVDKSNERGQIVGNFSKVSPFLPGDGSRGYLLSPRGKVTRIKVPGATVTFPHGINDHGKAVGGYTNANGDTRGFVWKRGRVRTFNMPGAAFTEAVAINNNGVIIGIYGDADADDTVHGFRLRNGHYKTFDAPRSTATVPFEINDRGQIALSGLRPTADDPFVGARGFVLRHGVRGPFTRVRFPGAPRTLVTGIDDQGRVVGVYENPNAVASARGAHTTSMSRVLDLLSPIR